eukprot:TRINITY_DN17791_c0_g1_i1.p1 TRINITY_DN17791_c0_g1~~TRINITY_DN17791_c0_g1_i1.p1  ORF type:complete len:283 (+),score=62.25 TRINITY_DN17791_c0_g1_i1:89-937(+)
MSFRLWHAIVSCFCSVGFLLLAIFALVERERLSPVYEDVWCKPSATSFGSVDLAPVEAIIYVDVTCTNPNPYELVVQPAEEGDLFLEEDSRLVGSAIVAGTTIPPEGKGTFKATATIRLSYWDTVLAAGDLLSGPFTVLFELRLNVLVAPTLMGFSSQMHIPVSEKCGLQLQLVPELADGDAACGSDFKELTIVALANKSKEETPGMKPDVSDDTVESAEEMRDTACGAIMGIGFVMSAVFALWLPIVIGYEYVTSSKSHRSVRVDDVPAQKIGLPPTASGM